MSWPGQRPSLETFVAEGSWLIFDLFEVKGKPEWLLIPSQHWAKFEEYRKIKEFADHLPVTNDSAERGSIALIKACIEKVTDESEKQDLIQIVANFRSKTTRLNKDVLNHL